MGVVAGVVWWCVVGSEFKEKGVLSLVCSFVVVRLFAYHSSVEQAEQREQSRAEQSQSQSYFSSPTQLLLSY